jgi:aspartyl-tRNA(Asn)/glutamyl-tRNA(Gln) amidotransferase subunit B
VLTAELDLAAYYEATAQGVDGKQAANWVINEVLGRANKQGVSPEELVKPEVSNAILALLKAETISNKSAKEVLDIHLESGEAPEAIVEARGLKQVTDTGAIEAALDAIIAANPEQVEKARVNPRLAGWFTGQVLKATGGQANPAVVGQMVNAKLGL